MHYRNFSGHKGVIIGTGPSLTQEQVNFIGWARHDNRCRVFGVNNAFQIAPFLDVLLACNVEWWDHYSKDEDFRLFRLLNKTVDLWTWDSFIAHKYQLNHVPGKWGDSFSTDPDYIHFGHSAGFQILNLAYHYGIREFILVGYDMKYGEGYDRGRRKPGSGRHFFGEYPRELQHWPKVGPNGEFTGLLKVFHTIDTEALGIRIINCTPDSALDFFEKGELEYVV